MKLNVLVCVINRVTSLVVAILLSAAAATPSIASYWTVPVDYYNDWSYVRCTYNAANVSEYNLGTSAMANISSYCQKSSSGTDRTYDPSRGWVTSMSAVNENSKGEVSKSVSLMAPYLQVDFSQYQQAMPNGFNQHAASVSFWVKPEDEMASEVLLSRGPRISSDNNPGGFVLVKDGKFDLTFTYFDSTSAETIKGAGSYQDPLFEDGVWTNIIITQVSSADGSGAGPYIAIYVNGILRGKGTKELSETYPNGILGNPTRNTADFGLIGNSGVHAGVKGCHEATGIGVDRSRSACSDSLDIRREGVALGEARAAATFTGLVSDYRWFLGLNLVCSAKTKSGYQLENKNVPINTKCDRTSDVSSLSRDRIEPSNIVARLPLRADLQDHNWAGLNSPAKLVKVSAPPVATDDDLRQRVMIFEGAEDQLVEWKLDKAPGLSEALSVWLKPQAHVKKMRILGLSTTKNYLKDFVWVSVNELNGISVEHFAEGNRPATEISSSPNAIKIGKWNHVVVSIDSAPNGPPDAKKTRVSIYVNGVSSGEGYIGPINYLGNATTMCISSNCELYADPYFPYVGAMSDAIVYNAPISVPQVTKLATRFPNAYEPHFGTVVELDGDTLRETKDGYFYKSFDPYWSRPPYQYDSITLETTIDWGIPGQPYKTSDGQTTPECEYLLAAMDYTGDSSPKGGNAYLGDPWGVADSSLVGLCFSPKKIAKKVNPFTIVLRYAAYRGPSNQFYLPLLDLPLSPRDVDALAGFSAENGVAGLTSRLLLNVGRYNTFVQLKTESSSLYPEVVKGMSPNYIAPLYFGSQPLVSELLGQTSVSGKPRDIGDLNYIVPAASTSSAITLFYADQIDLINEIDAFLSKDR